MKKARNLTHCRPQSEALALPTLLDGNGEAHANMRTTNGQIRSKGVPFPKEILHIQVAQPAACP